MYCARGWGDNVPFKFVVNSCPLGSIRLKWCLWPWLCGQFHQRYKILGCAMFIAWMRSPMVGVTKLYPSESTYCGQLLKICLANENYMSTLANPNKEHDVWACYLWIQDWNILHSRSESYRWHVNDFPLDIYFYFYFGHGCVVMHYWSWTIIGAPILYV